MKKLYQIIFTVIGIIYVFSFLKIKNFSDSTPPALIGLGIGVALLLAVVLMIVLDKPTTIKHENLPDAVSDKNNSVQFDACSKELAEKALRDMREGKYLDRQSRYPGHYDS